MRTIRQILIELLLWQNKNTSLEKKIEWGEAQLKALFRVEEGVCPRCKSLLTFPRGDTPYCEECGYPDKDFNEKPKRLKG